MTERELIDLLSDPYSEVSVVLPDITSLSADEAWEQLKSVVNVHKAAESIALRLRPVIGKMLLWARHNPEFYERKGFRTYDDFINDYVCGTLHLGRTSLYQARRLAEHLPNLTSEEVEELGITKSLTLAEYTQTSDPSFPEYLREARHRTAAGLKKWAEERNLIEAGEMETAAILIRSNATVEKMWAEFRENPDVQSYVGSDHAFRILEALIREGYFWLGRPHDVCPGCNGSGRVEHHEPVQ